MPQANLLWLVAKELIIMSFYFIIILQCSLLKKYQVYKEFRLLLWYVFITSLIYIYSFIGHKIYVAWIVGFRAELFYIPLSLIVMSQLDNKKFILMFYRVLLFTALANCAVALIQFFLPNLLLEIPGFQGIKTHVVVSTVRSFNYDLINFLTGMFASADKLSRSLTSIGVLIFLIHLIFGVGKPRHVYIVAILILIVTLLSGKRLPFVIWSLIYLSIILTNLLVSRKKIYYINSAIITKNMLRAKSYSYLNLIFIPVIILVAITLLENFHLYLDMILYLFTTEIQLRFLNGGGGDYFFQSEWQLIKSTGYFFGQGVGTNTIGVDYLLGTELRSTLKLHSVEHGPLAVLLEAGILGGIKIALLWIVVIGRGTYHHFINDFPVNIKLASSIILLYQLFTLSSFFVAHSYWGDVQVQIYFWSIFGIQQYLLNRMSGSEK